MKSLSIPFEGNPRSLSRFRVYAGTIEGWLKSHEISAFFLTQFPIYLAMGAMASLVPMRWRLIGVMVGIVISVAVVELFEDAAPRTKTRFWDVIRDQTA